MGTPTSNSGLSASSLLTKAVYATLGIVTIYFVFTRAFPYLNYAHAEKNYGTKSLFIFAHVIFGISATLIGPFQFVSAIRKRNVLVHRTMGKIYLLCTMFGSLVSWVVISQEVDLGYKSGLILLGFAWISCGIMAYLSIRRGCVEIHRQWMVRSYVVTLAFVTFRLVADFIRPYHYEGASAMLAWGCWAVPLFITEIVFQLRKIYGKVDGYPNT